VIIRKTSNITRLRNGVYSLLRLPMPEERGWLKSQFERSTGNPAVTSPGDYALNTEIE
jgi:hypothetical protein